MRKTLCQRYAPRRYWTTASAGAALGLALAISPAAAQSQDSTTPDSAQVAACSQLKVYAKRIATDSIKAAWKRGTLFNVSDNGAVQPQLPEVKIEDSVQTLVKAAGPSCQPLPNATALNQIAQAQMQGRRPIIGVQLRPLTAQDTVGRGLTSLRGAAVQSVSPNMGAQAAGIVEGDVLLAVNGKQLAAPPQFIVLTGTWTDGQVVNIEVVRKDGKHEKLDVTAKMK